MIYNGQNTERLGCYMLFKSCEFKSSDVEGRVFRGYASTYDTDQAQDTIQKGAFTKTISERGDRVKVLWQHSEPIGKPVSIKEDDVGLYVEALVSKTRTGDEALELMKDGVVDQMSIGFSVPEGKSKIADDGGRIITEIKLFEFSPVTFPCNEKAFILGVKNINEALKTKDFLVDDDSKKSLLAMFNSLQSLLSEPSRTQKSADTRAIKQTEIDAISKAFDKFKF
jgi:HK97 family phage prohead protease